MTHPVPDASLDAIRFDGRLSRAPVDIDAAAEDFGRIYHRHPQAVLYPGSVADIARAVQWARAASVPVAARGRGHSTAGQAQTTGGLVIDMACLSQVGAAANGYLEVAAGTTWKQVLDYALPRGVMPPVVPDHLGLSVGGTICLGGLGYQTCRYGTVVANVAAVQVVTGTGEVVSCSEVENRDLFVAARGGLGQFGIITSATLMTIPAPQRIRLTRLLYTDLHLLLEDLVTLAAAADPYDTIAAFTIANDPDMLRSVLHEAAEGLWFAPWMFRRLFILQLGRYDFDTGERASNTRPGAEGNVPDVARVWTDSFAAFADRAAEHRESWNESGLWDAAHPWLDVVVPQDAAARWLEGILEELEPTDPADGPVMIYPMRPDRRGDSFLQLPACEQCVRVDVLRCVLPDSQRTPMQFIARNREWYGRAVEAGGVHYPSGAIALTAEEWRLHFAHVWPAFVQARDRYDPAHILAPGQGI